MSERDPVHTLLKELDRPLAPRSQFADALRARLLAELAQRDGFRALPRQHRRPVVAGALALAIAAAAVTATLLSRPSPASALEVIKQARRAFAMAPPFQATLRVDLNPDGANRSVPEGATATVVVSYGGPGRFRTQIASEQPRLRNASSPGSYQVFNGRRIGTFDPKRQIFYSSAAPTGFRPLEFLSWHGAYPDWERICRGQGSRVLPGARIAGRDARHIRCGDFKGGFWQLWIDRQTGLLLKIVGQIGGDDFFLGLGASTSAKGGFAVEQLRYNPTFPARRFALSAPPGALDLHARLQAAMAKVPPFRAVFSGRYGRSGPVSYVDEAWWLNDQSWRRTVLVDRPSDPRGSGGAGSFFVSAHGHTDSYNTHDKTSSRTSSPAFDPIAQLLPEEDVLYSSTSCPIVGHDRIAGREAVHRRCKTGDIWIDNSTGIALRARWPAFDLRVRSIEYNPAFPPGTFRFVPPAGSRNAQQLATNPYYKTKLARGKPAPNWHAATLGGGTFQLAQLRGKPALLLLFPDWCPAGDPVCNVLAPLEQVHERSKDKATIVWIDWQGNANQATKIVRHNHLTFPVVIDTKGISVKTWNVQGWPYWLLLDSHGRVIEARFKPQTTTQLRQLLAKTK